MHVLTTDRLELRQVSTVDAPFMLAILNDPAFIRHIGDRGVRSVDDARRYIRDRMLASYQEHGFGMYLVERKADRVAVGICGLVKRPELDDVDIGFAFLPDYCRQGYAHESAVGVLQLASGRFGLQRIVAITSQDNQPSIRLLEKLAFSYEKNIRLSNDADPVKLFSWQPAA